MGQHLADWPTVRPMTRRVGGMVRGAATALASLVLAHNLIFLAGYGARFARAMATTGHPQGWFIAAAVSIALGLVLLAAGSWRIHRLRSQAREIGARRLSTEPNRTDFVRLWLRWWLALALTTAMLFVLEENIELARISARLPGIGVLASAAYADAILIIAAVAFVVSLVATLLGWKIRLLATRIGAVRSAGHRAPVPTFLASDPFDRRRGSILGRRLAVRAPPFAIVS
jgi:hypothetical protein